MGAALPGLTVAGLLQNWHYGREGLKLQKLEYRYDLLSLRLARRQKHLDQRSLVIAALQCIREDIRDRAHTRIMQLENLQLVVSLLLITGFGVVCEGTFPEKDAARLYEFWMCVYATLCGFSLLLPFLSLLSTVLCRMRLNRNFRDNMHWINEVLDVMLENVKNASRQTPQSNLLEATPKARHAQPGPVHDEDDSSSAEQQLWRAAERGDSARARVLLERAPDPAALVASPRDSDDRNALHIAASTGQGALLCILFEKSAPNDLQALLAMPDRCGCTALHLATLGGHVQAVNLLLQSAPDRGALILAQDVRLATVLHVAATFGHEEIAVLLMERTTNKRALLEAKDEEGYTPLHVAQSAGHWNLVQLIEDEETLVVVQRLVLESLDLKRSEVEGPLVTYWALGKWLFRAGLVIQLLTLGVLSGIIFKMQYNYDGRLWLRVGRYDFSYDDRIWLAFDGVLVGGVLLGLCFGATGEVYQFFKGHPGEVSDAFSSSVAASPASEERAAAEAQGDLCAPLLQGGRASPAGEGTSAANNAVTRHRSASILRFETAMDAAASLREPATTRRWTDARARFQTFIQDIGLGRLGCNRRRKKPGGGGGGSRQMRVG